MRPPWPAGAAHVLLIGWLGFAGTPGPPTEPSGTARGGWAVPVVCAGTIALFTIVFIPCTPVTVAAGVALGPVAGLACAMGGSAAGLAAAFLVARHGLRGRWRARLESSRVFRAVATGVTDDPWRIIILSRLSPVTPYHLLNYTYGLTGVRFSTYMAASLIGMLAPLAAVVWTSSAAGDLAAGRSSGRVFLLLLAGSALFAALAYGVPRRRGGGTGNAPPAAG